MSKSAKVRVALEKSPKALMIGVESPTGACLVYCLEAGAWGRLDADQKRVITNLTRTHIPGKALEVEMTYADMRVFKALADSTPACPAVPMMSGERYLEAMERAAERKSEEAGFLSDPDFRRAKAADEIGENFQEPPTTRTVRYTSKSGRTDRYEVIEEFTDRIMYGISRGQTVKLVRLRPLSWDGNPFVVPANRCQAE